MKKDEEYQKQEDKQSLILLPAMLLDILARRATRELLESTEEGGLRFEAAFLGQGDQRIFFVKPFGYRLFETIYPIAVDKIVVAHLQWWVNTAESR